MNSDIPLEIKEFIKLCKKFFKLYSQDLELTNCMQSKYTNRNDSNYHHNNIEDFNFKTLDRHNIVEQINLPDDQMNKLRFSEKNRTFPLINRASNHSDVGMQTHERQQSLIQPTFTLRADKKYKKKSVKSGRAVK